MIPVTLSADKKVVLTIQPLDDKFRPAKVDGAPQWAQDVAANVRVTPSADGLSCEVAWLAAGDTLVNVMADSDMGTTVLPVSETARVTTKQRQATRLLMTVGPELDAA